MKTRTLKKNKVNVVTLGCSKNVYDSEVMMGQLQASKFDVVHESTDNDAAKQESIDTILRFAEARKEGRIDKLIVTGCLSERYKPDLEREIGDVDEYFGTRDLPRLLKSLGADYKHELTGERLLTTPSHFAYLKISEGCDRPCSFCAIPLMRGNHRSVPVEELIAQSKQLAAKGVKELVLIAQDLTYYGLDIYGKRDLARLLNELSGVNGIEWIRLHYAFPSGFPEEVLDVMNAHENICKYLDMPLQHISDNMLKSMRRGINKKKTVDLVNRIRDKVPGLTLRTTLIAGYPGETEADHEEMLEWVRDTRFERLGIFTYSHEENTHAYSLNDDVEEEVKLARASAVMDVQRSISADHNEARVGNTFKVLVDRKEGNYFIGRTESDSPEVDNEVLIDAEKQYVRIGDFCNVKITEANDFDLLGEVV